MDEAAAPPPVLRGWGALVLAIVLAGWGAAPLMRPAGPDLAGLPPPVREAPGAAGAGGSATRPRRPPKIAPAGRVDLNRATPADLATLPGIGPALAARIVEHRQAVGPFPRLEALRAVPGIGPKRYDTLVPHLTVGGPPPVRGPHRRGEDRP